MKRIVAILMSALLVMSCGLVKHVPVETKTVINYKDSTVISYRDSVILVEIPKEVIKDVVPQYDTLYMETSVASAMAYVDTSVHVLKGSLENKHENTIERIVYLPSEEHIVYKDSVVVQQIPVEVEVIKTKYPKMFWFLLAFFIGVVAYVGLKIYLKFKI